ncbi:hypothetical protein KIPB_008054 [Kipferlia bialata]|uniref:Uncharacterized protein n=1 Tax=Kipferlia bialata TaxID=797122 RepID=A0A9K3D2S7_9EUKA|nr:hypothetical protein KIPB_008054 [Kipferlia bialata]|eukprot:g8054.t1
MGSGQREDHLMAELQLQTREARARIESLQQKLKEEQARHAEDKDQLDQLDRIRSIIVNLYLELRDRSAEETVSEAQTAEKTEEERELLKSQNPLIVLDQLRASLRVLLAFKEDFEAELRQELASRSTNRAETIRQLMQQVATVSDQRDSLTQEVTVLRNFQAEAKAEGERVAEEYQGVVGRVQEKNTALEGIIDSRDKELLKLRKKINELTAELKDKDFRLVRISQLESQLQVNRMQHQFDMAKTHAGYNKTLKRLQREVELFGRVEAENAQYREDIARMETEVVSYRKNMRTQRTQSAEAEVKRLTEQLARQAEQQHLLETRVRSAEKANERMRADTKQLTAKYSRLYASTQAKSRRREDAQEAEAKKTKRKARPSTAQPRSGGAGGDAGSSAEGNPFQLESYKRRLVEKDKEIEELARRVRRLLALQHRSQLAQKAWSDERHRLEGQLAARDPMRSSSRARSRQSGREAKSDEHMQSAIRELENLRAVSVTTAAAYDRLSEATKRQGRPGTAGRARPMTAGATPTRPGTDHSMRGMSSMEGDMSVFDDNLRMPMVPMDLSTAGTPSAPPNRHRPVSANGTRLNRVGAGGTTGGRQVGALLPKRARPQSAVSFGMRK